MFQEVRSSLRVDFETTPYFIFMLDSKVISGKKETGKTLFDSNVTNGEPRKNGRPE